MASVGEIVVSGTLKYKILSVAALLSSGVVSCIGFAEGGSSSQSVQIPSEIEIETGIYKYKYKVTSIAEGAFKNKTIIKELTVGSNVESIGESAFSGCSNLTRITILGGVRNIGEGAFSGCYSLVNIAVSIENTVYESIDGSLYRKDRKTLIQYAIGRTDTSFRIPSGVTSIGYAAFQNCKNLTSVTIPDSVTNISSYAFASCYGITSVVIPNSVTGIGYSAFENCSSLTSVTIGDNVTSIGSYAFRYCTSLTSVTIGDGVESIGGLTFQNCEQLQTIYINCIKKACKFDISEPSFYGAPETAKLIFKTISDLDFIGFTFNGKHCYYDLNIYRVSDGDRYNILNKAEATEKTVEVPGADGLYYFGSQYKSRSFPINFAFDCLTDEELRNLRQFCFYKDISDLIFDEEPYKVYSAKISGDRHIKAIPFDSAKGRVYKGEGQINFICYWPYAHTPNENTKISTKFALDGKFGEDGKQLVNYDHFDNKDLWKETSKLPEDANCGKGENLGDIPAHFTLKCKFEETGKYKFIVGDVSIEVDNPQGNYKELIWNSKSGIVSAKIQSNSYQTPIYCEGDFCGTIPVSINGSRVNLEVKKWNEGWEDYLRVDENLSWKKKNGENWESVQNSEQDINLNIFDLEYDYWYY